MFRRSKGFQVFDLVVASIVVYVMHLMPLVALPTEPDGGPLEFHCGRVMYLTPSGWICRSCDFGRNA